MPMWAWITLEWAAGAIGVVIVAGTLASMTRSAAWWVRVWDFPRVQMAVIAFVAAVVFAMAGGRSGYGPIEYIFGVLLLASFGWQIWGIWPYTPLATKQVQRARGLGKNDARAIRLVISNVLQDNREYDRWRDVVLREDADVIAAAEVDDEWVRQIDAALAETHPHTVKCPLDNLYGLALWSRLPMHDAKVEFIVQDDIPSIHGQFELRDGTRVNFHCLHPRPPVPNESDSSGPRDAELVLVGRRVGANRDRDHTPTLVFGDMNDVAWSRTTDLFCKLGRLLDLRKGRGFYNTFSANSRILRFPLDHIFISPEFRLIDMRVLDHVGSDHFPVGVTLAFEPEKKHAQPAEAADAGEEQEATERASAAHE